MRVESTQGKDEWKCWLNPEEREALNYEAKDRSKKHHVVILLGSLVGLRAEEMTLVRPCDVQRTTEGDYLLRVVGKDTTGEHGRGKQRDAYLSVEVERELYELQREHEIDGNEPYLNVTPSRIRQIVHEVSEEVASQIELYEDPDTEPGAGADWPARPDDWRKVSSHDLRRFWAQDWLVRRGLDVRVVMAVGGWSDYSAIEPYLKAPTEENIVSEFND